MNQVFAYFRMKFEGRYSVAQVIYALDKYTDQKNDIPAPADILTILNPQKPRITDAEFVEAQKWQERNNFPAFSEAKKTIDAYKAQQEDARDAYAVENRKLLAIAESSIKTISN